jgi:hypothetical protein
MLNQFRFSDAPAPRYQNTLVAFLRQRIGDSFAFFFSSNEIHPQTSADSIAHLKVFY